MIKINLLPPHVVERRKVRGLAILLVALLLFEIGGLFFYYSTLVRARNEKQKILQDTTVAADRVTGYQAAAAAELAAAGQVLVNVGWYDGIYRNNAKIADSLSKVNEYIYAKMTINSLVLSGAQVTLQGATKDLDHIASAYLNLLRCPYITPARGVTFTPSLGGQPNTRVGPTGLRPGISGPVRPGLAGPGRMQGMPNSSSLTPQTTVAPIGGNPNEAVKVTFRITLKPEFALAGGARQSGRPGPAGGGGPGIIGNPIQNAMRGRPNAGSPGQ
jgi:hypothetical protein